MCNAEYALNYIALPIVCFFKVRGDSESFSLVMDSMDSYFSMLYDNNINEVYKSNV